MQLTMEISTDALWISYPQPWVDSRLVLVTKSFSSETWSLAFRALSG